MSRNPSSLVKSLIPVSQGAMSILRQNSPANFLGLYGFGIQNCVVMVLMSENSIALTHIDRFTNFASIKAKLSSFCKDAKSPVDFKVLYNASLIKKDIPSVQNVAVDNLEKTEQIVKEIFGLDLAKRIFNTFEEGTVLLEWDRKNPAIVKTKKTKEELVSRSAESKESQELRHKSHYLNFIFYGEQQLRTDFDGTNFSQDFIIDENLKEDLARFAITPLIFRDAFIEKWNEKYPALKLDNSLNRTEINEPKFEMINAMFKNYPQLEAIFHGQKIVPSSSLFPESAKSQVKEKEFKEK